jgi:hypothetical protein
MCIILVCSFFLLSSFNVTGNVAGTSVEDSLDDVAYYEQRSMRRSEDHTFVDTMPEVDIESISVECTNTALIVTLTMQGSFPVGHVEGYTYFVNVFTETNYGIITVTYETDYGSFEPGGWASLGISPEFSISERSLIMVLDDVILDETAVTDISGTARFDAADGGMFIDWLPDGVEKDAADGGTDDEETSDDEQDNSDDQSVDNTITEDSEDITDESYSSEDTENSVETDSPGFELMFLFLAIAGFIIIYKQKKKEN